MSWSIYVNWLILLFFNVSDEMTPVPPWKVCWVREQVWTPPENPPHPRQVNSTCPPHPIWVTGTCSQLRLLPAWLCLAIQDFRSSLIQWKAWFVLKISCSSEKMLQIKSILILLLRNEMNFDLIVWPLPTWQYLGFYCQPFPACNLRNPCRYNVSTNKQFDYPIANLNVNI